MKKTLAFILVCALLVSAFTLTAFAANVVGTHGNTGTVEDGVADFDDSDLDNNTGNITVKVDTVVHKYAVDVDYTIPAYELPGITWNVNTLKYDTTTVAADKKFTNHVTIELTNYSDKPVNTQVTAVDEDGADGIAFNWESVESETTAHSTNIDFSNAVGTTTVAKAQLVAVAYKPNNVGSEATKVVYTLNVDCADEVATVLYFESIGKLNTPDLVIGAYTVTVAN